VHTTTEEEKKIVLKSRNPTVQSQSGQKQVVKSGQPVQPLQKKPGALKNVNRSTDVAPKVLEKDTGNYQVRRNGLAMGKEIMKRRNELGLTQKELGVKVEEKVSLVQQYEQGNAVPNGKVIAKFERELEVQLKHLMPKIDKSTADDELVQGAVKT